VSRKTTNFVNMFTYW